ncbi:hypothetical protein JCM10213_003571 [Rhodosporidiobolus nylandii]
MAPRFLLKLGDEVGIDRLRKTKSPRDVSLLILSRFVRMLAFGSGAPILVLYLNSLGFEGTEVGLFLSLTLVGDVVLSLVVSWVADRIGRRNVLAAGSLAMAASGFVFYTSKSYIPLLLAATFGVISPSGNEVGPFSAVEGSILSQLVQPEDRIYLMMYYGVVGYVGLAAGSVYGGHLVTLAERADSTNAYRAVFLPFGIIGLVKVVFSFAMTPYAELNHPPFPPPRPEPVEPSSPTHSDHDSASERQPLLARPHLDRPLYDRTASSTPHMAINPVKVDLTTEEAGESSLPLLHLLFVAILFSVDSFASSLTPAAYVSLYLKENFDASISAITWVLASSALGAVFTSLLAGALVKRTGLVVSMVASHIPAQILTIAMAFAPTAPSVFALYILRTCLSSVDSSIRSALLSAMVPKAARTRLLGTVDVCRTLAAAPGPFVTGRLVSIGLLAYTFCISGGIKIGYDLALLVGLRSVKLHY